ncbi:MAG: hypothetical protein ACE5FP_08400 [Gemmatimonadota bacterium]
MPTLRVNFASCIHDSEDYGSDDRRIVSRVFLSIWCEGLRYSECYADIAHPVGGDLKTDPLEITLPQGYDGPISAEGFRRAAGQYYRSLVGRELSATRAGESDIRLRDHTFLLPRSFEFPLGCS